MCAAKNGLHALIIGVSSYPYATKWGVKSVPGPAVAAARFAEWLRTSYRNPAVEVLPARVLLSPTDGEVATVAEAAGAAHGRADSTSVKRAVREWADDCNVNPGDIGLLYLAGHGTDMVLGGGFLLLEDFGEPDDPLGHALDIDYLMDAMSTRLAHTNFIFVDACRNTIEEQLKYDFHGIRNLTLDLTDPVQRRVLKVFYGAAPDQRAWTTPDDEVLEHGTVFGKSLLSALKKSAVDLSPTGDLCVTANRLAEETARGVRAEAQALNETYAQDILGSTEGIGTLEDVPFHRPDVVQIDLEIELDPAVAATIAQAHLFKVVSAMQADYDRDILFDPHPTRIKVNSGKYRLQVQSPPPPPSPFTMTIQDWLVMPSSTHWKVTLQYGS